MTEFDDIFGQKEPEKMELNRPEGVPLKDVIQFKEKGLSNNQIIQILQRDGYNATQINDALNQSKITQTIKPIKIEGETMVENPMNNFGQVPQGQQPQPMQNPMQPQMNMQQPQETTDERIQEIAESIIEEKWEDVVQNMNKVIEWKEKVETELTSLEQQFKDLKDNFDKVHTGLIGKVGEYDTHIQDIGTNIKAMEEVFKKILPGFIENVNKLDDIVDKAKK